MTVFKLIAEFSTIQMEEEEEKEAMVLQKRLMSHLTDDHFDTERCFFKFLFKIVISKMNENRVYHKMTNWH